MAKIKSQSTSLFLTKPKKNNKGVHATTQTSKNKKATNYKKPYKGQGR